MSQPESIPTNGNGLSKDQTAQAEAHHRDQEGREGAETTHQISSRENEHGQGDRIAQGDSGRQAIGELKMLGDRRQRQRDDGRIQCGKEE